MLSGRNNRLMLVLLLALVIGVTSRVAAQDGRDDGPVRVRPRSCNVEVLAHGFRGEMTEKIRVRASAYVIRLETLSNQPVEWHDYRQLNGDDYVGSARFTDVPVPVEGKPYFYKLTVTYLGKYRRRKVDPDHDGDDETAAVREYDRQFYQTREVRLVPDDAGHTVTSRIEIHSFDVPIY